MRTLHIVHLVWRLGVGGLEEMLVDIANEQSRRARVWIIVINNPVDPTVVARVLPSVTLFFLHRKEGSRAIGAILHLNWLLRRIRPDIVHAHHWNHGKLLLNAPGQPVLTVHTTREARDFDPSIRRYRRVFAISRAVLDDIRAYWPDLQSLVVHNGVTCSDILSERTRRDDVFRIVQVARLEHHHKGQDILLRALARVRRDPEASHIRLDLIGTGESRGYLETLARDLGLEGIVSFRGTVQRTRLYQELCEYDLLVQPSRWEGFGLVVVEGMAAGVPVLVSDTEGPSEIVDRGRFGFLFRPEDDADCARQILRIHKMRGMAALAQLILTARARATEKFDVTVTAGEYLRHYADLLGYGRNQVEERLPSPLVPTEAPKTRVPS